MKENLSTDIQKLSCNLKIIHEHPTPHYADYRQNVKN